MMQGINTPARTPLTFGSKWDELGNPLDAKAREMVRNGQARTTFLPIDGKTIIQDGKVVAPARPSVVASLKRLVRRLANIFG